MTITFSGVKSVKLVNLLYVLYLSFYEKTYIIVSLFNKYHKNDIDLQNDTFDKFLQNNFSKEDVIKDILNINEIESEDIYLICSFKNDNNGLDYSKLSVEGLPPQEIKKIMFEVLKEFSNYEIFFLDHNKDLDLKKNISECIKNGNPNVELKDLVNV